MKKIIAKIFYHLKEKYVYNRDLKKLGLTFSEFSNYANIRWDQGASNNGITTLFGKQIKKIVDVCYVESILEIYLDGIYAFKTQKESPYIIDCGSNIGLSVIFFKRLFPKAEVLAFEADSEIAGYCSYNIEQFGFENVKVENAAVWKENGTINFEGNGSLGGKLVEGDAGTSIPAIRLRDYLIEREVDLLKIDIEGVETEVLLDSEDALDNVKTIFIEFHGRTGEKQELPVLLNLLSKKGFRYHIKEATSVMSKPFVEYNTEKIKNKPFDVQLNIFGYR